MIVVESGGTKSTWVFYNSLGTKVDLVSVGLHPQELTSHKEKLISELIDGNQLKGRDIYFFGAGCESLEAKIKVTHFLEQHALIVKQVETDIYAACVAHLREAEGIVGILGTGAVAAHFDGQKVVQQTSGLGYLLGDEGSGFDIGKRLLQSYFRNELPKAIRQEIEIYFNHQSILYRIYESDGRMFIAGLTKVVHDFKSESVIVKLLNESFLAFCETALHPLNPKYSINFIGSVAYYFEDEIGRAVSASGYQLGKVEREAIHGVFAFLSDK